MDEFSQQPQRDSDSSGCANRFSGCYCSSCTYSQRMASGQPILYSADYGRDYLRNIFEVHRGRIQRRMEKIMSAGWKQTRSAAVAAANCSEKPCTNEREGHHGQHQLTTRREP